MSLPESALIPSISNLKQLLQSCETTPAETNKSLKQRRPKNKKQPTTRDSLKEALEKLIMRHSKRDQPNSQSLLSQLKGVVNAAEKGHLQVDQPKQQPQTKRQSEGPQRRPGMPKQTDKAESRTGPPARRPPGSGQVVAKPWLVRAADLGFKHIIQSEEKLAHALDTATTALLCQASSLDTWKDMNALLQGAPDKKGTILFSGQMTPDTEAFFVTETCAQRVLPGSQAGTLKMKNVYVKHFAPEGQEQTLQLKQEAKIEVAAKPKAATDKEDSVVIRTALARRFVTEDTWQQAKRNPGRAVRDWIARHDHTHLRHIEDVWGWELQDANMIRGRLRLSKATAKELISKSGNLQEAFLGLSNPPIGRQSALISHQHCGYPRTIKKTQQPICAEPACKPLRSAWHWALNR